MGRAPLKNRQHDRLYNKLLKTSIKEAIIVLAFAMVNTFNDHNIILI